MEYTDNEPMEKVITSLNEEQRYVTECGSQLHTPPFVGKLGTYDKGNEFDKVLDGTFNFPPEIPNDAKDFI